MASGSDSALQLLTQCPTARRPWYYWVWQMRLSLIYRLLDGHALSVSGQYWGQKFLQGGHHKGLHPVEVTILGHHQMTPVSWSIGQSSPDLRGAEQGHLQLLTQYLSAGSRVWSGVCTMAGGWQSRTGGEGILFSR